MLTLNNFTSFPSAFVVDFEQVNVWNIVDLLFMYQLAWLLSDENDLKILSALKVMTHNKQHTS